jgi:alanyl-tRNA synthetase
MNSYENTMTTKRSYYGDAYMVSFDARVVERMRLDNRWAVVLDQTYFYPTSGGQPHDTGTIDGIKVLDVTVREEDEAILHIVEGEIDSERVHCEIDWPRRFDHMQQHSGQHILSAAFEQLLDADTIGFHLGAETSTIDLNLDGLTTNQLAEIEELANGVVFMDRPIVATIVSPGEASRLALRKPPAVSGPVRIVTIQDFDRSACGGTHVRRTGEIGVIKITKLESRGADLRVEFLCGRRALADYREKNALVTRIGSSFTTAQNEIEDAIDRLREEARTLRSDLRKARAQLLEYEADDLYKEAERCAGIMVILGTFIDRDRNDLNWLARNLADRPGVVVLFGLAGAKCHLLFARAADVDRDMVPLLKSALGVLGSTSGGGRPEIAQGGGPPAEEASVARALNHAKQQLLTAS